MASSIASLARSYLERRFDEQARKFPRMLDIGRAAYVRRNLRQTIRNMRAFPPGNPAHVSEAWNA